MGTLWATTAHELVDVVPRPLPSLFNDCKTVHLGDTLSEATALLGGAWERYGHRPTVGEDLLNDLGLVKGNGGKDLLCDPFTKLKGETSWTVATSGRISVGGMKRVGE